MEERMRRLEESIEAISRRLAPTTSTSIQDPPESPRSSPDSATSLSVSAIPPPILTDLPSSVSPGAAAPSERVSGPPVSSSSSLGASSNSSSSSAGFTAPLGFPTLSALPTSPYPPSAQIGTSPTQPGASPLTGLPPFTFEGLAVTPTSLRPTQLTASHAIALAVPQICQFYNPVHPIPSPLLDSLSHIQETVEIVSHEFINRNMSSATAVTILSPLFHRLIKAMANHRHSVDWDTLDDLAPVIRTLAAQLAQSFILCLNNFLSFVTVPTALHSLLDVSLTLLQQKYKSKPKSIALTVKRNDVPAATESSSDIQITATPTSSSNRARQHGRRKH